MLEKVNEFVAKRFAKKSDEIVIIEGEETKEEPKKMNKRKFGFGVAAGVLAVLTGVGLVALSKKDSGYSDLETPEFNADDSDNVESAE